MSTHEGKSRTEKVDEVLVGSDSALAAVARAVRDVNETLAVHAAWTEERFEAADDRLVSLAQTLSKLEQKAERLDLGQEAMQQGLATLIETMQGLTAG